ncbi:sigma-54-dependent transcriptional regulator [Fulvivirga lutea]|uniref:Sigma-54-dependent Fis family transcriptional regulator n=1 Tax=Fulvivirga lutea TaxID=2810512 RepID=A0A975A0P2_9BACT|nr:sigma-54 dependent transcriptional regulator [Fulvivirga lutea]QSE97405.1 sigma-54-dependent Fis family transcriptional regulator [Fulvivirga lutea]
MNYKVLIIDDDEDICLLLERLLSKNDYSVSTAEDGESGFKLLKKDKPDLVLCDFKLPDYSGIDMLRKIKVLHPQLPVIIITGYSDVKIAVDALKKGAYNYVTKPLYPDEILMMVKEAISSHHQPILDSKSTKPKKSQKEELTIIKGASPQSEVVWKHVDLIAPTNMSVIIQGETGTGKEYVARAIHLQSERKGHKFLAVDCGALSDDLAGSELFGHVKGSFTGAINDKSGCFEQAKGGTLFLDEIGNLSYENQMKMLRALQERKIRRVGGDKEIDIDVRVVVATNEPLPDLIQSGDFREDLYHRLNEFKIELAPLRERKADIVIYAEYFLKLANDQLNKNIKGFDKSALEVIKHYSWEGNLRELKNVIKRAVLLASSTTIDKTCLPAEIVTGIDHTSVNAEDNLSLKAAVKVAEIKAINMALKKAAFNKSKAAEYLEVDRKTLYNKLNEYGII